jgi:HD-GYP domain-containing protein (c-di-GMP phosphodiesterase class II)
MKLSRYLDGNYSDALSSEEIKYMRMHSKLSYDLLADKGFSNFLLKSVLYHHENYNGTGYPDGLKGDEIPLGARILRASDVFSALISHRSYRQGFGVDAAVEIMIDEIENYDMEVFIAFQKIINKEEIRDYIEKERLNI